MSRREAGHAADLVRTSVATIPATSPAVRDGDAGEGVDGLQQHPRLQQLVCHRLRALADREAAELQAKRQRIQREAMEIRARAEEEARRLAEEAAREAEVRSMHWSPYDRVRVVNADP